MIPIVLISIICVAVCPFLPLTDNEMILWSLRIPRVLAAFIAGGGLAIAGLIFQSLFRNDLASPYILGIASAGSLGSNLAIFLGLGHLFMTGFSFIFSLASVFIIWTITTAKKIFHPAIVLLSGVAIGMISSSFILFLQVFSHERDLMQMAKWMMGSLNIVGFQTIWIITPFVLLALVITYFYTGELNLLTVDDDFAQSRGVDIIKIRKILFVLASLITAPIVAELGPIGFIGLVIPHMVKRITSKDHRELIITSFFAGGAFLALCDLLSRVILENGVMPIGVITSMIGAPIFLMILVRANSHSN